MPDASGGQPDPRPDPPPLLLDDPAHLYEHAPCGYLSTDASSTIIRVNRTLQRMIGHDAADLVGRRTLGDLMAGGSRMYLETHLAPLLHATGGVHEIAIDLLAADGSRLPVLLNATAHRDDGGRVARIDVAVFDASARRAYERELLRAKEEAERSEARARALARTLQQTLIPPVPPAIPGLDVAAAYRPAGDGSEVGGDFYDVFEVAADDWVVALGDVRGKGVDAAVVTALARFTLRGACVGMPSPSQALRALNEVLLHQGTDRFLTAVLLRLRRDGHRWTATICCGGHPSPTHVRRGSAPAAVECAGTLLGVLEDPRLEDVTVPLGPGDRLVATTDGVTEGRRGRTFYGVDRLHDVLLATDGADAGTTASSLLEDVLAFQRDDPRDDIAVVVVRTPDPPTGGSDAR